MKLIRQSLLFIFLLLFYSANLLNAQTTGKIAGKVIDRDSKEPLLGANILIAGTNMGAATNENGEYFIINVPPGKYNVKFSMIGYGSVLVEGAQVSVNRTTTLDETLQSEDYKLEEVVVTVKAVNDKKDKTSSVNNISADQIKTLPVESVSDIVGLQAGVVQGHFRGGRNTEVSYLVDGVSVIDGYSRQGFTVEIENEAVQDLEVITGTFNAEYGRAMSGVVNIVTKEGGEKFKGSASSSFSNYFPGNDNVYIGLKPSHVDRNQDYKLQFEGPIYNNYITFFTNGRYQNNKGYLNGIRRFNVNDYSNFSNTDINKGVSTPWDFEFNNNTYYSEHTGDNAFVPMNTFKQYSILGKLTFRPVTDIKFSLMYSKSDGERQNYQHNLKYKPDGRRTYYDKSNFYLFQLTHLISKSMFHDFKVSYKKVLYEDYLYKDPFDPKYVADNYNSSINGFVTGGQDKGYNSVELNDLNIKYDLTWQANTHHSFKLGAEYTKHDLTKKTIIVRDVKYGTAKQDEFSYDPITERIKFNPYEPEILALAVSADNYNKKPFEFSSYLQDKMEYENLVMNFGVRYDYFNANTIYPTQLRNPANQDSYPDNPERMSEYPKAKPQMQYSPRFGLSYTLGSTAVLHFSYGHFFQMPPLYALYQNSRFLIPSGNFETVIGNPNLKPEKTVQYEMGIWQELQQNLGLEVSVFYRDIYDLQTAIVITTFNQVKYGYFSNKDYGNAKGLEVKLDYKAGQFLFFGNYTLQFTRGIADNPTSSFTRAGENLDEISKLIPLEWDQRHTINLSAGYQQENFAINLIGTFNSGIAYTYKPISESTLSKQTLFPNNEHRPAMYDLSLKGNYDIPLLTDVKLRLFLSIYNLLDRRNEVTVNETTGRAYTAIIRPTEISTFKSNFDDIYDASQDPSMFSAPREIKFGVGIVF